MAQSKSFTYIKSATPENLARGWEVELHGVASMKLDITSKINDGLLLVQEKLHVTSLVFLLTTRYDLHLFVIVGTYYFFLKKKVPMKVCIYNPLPIDVQQRLFKFTFC